MVLCLPHLIPTGTPPISRLAHGNAQRDAWREGRRVGPRKAQHFNGNHHIFGAPIASKQRQLILKLIFPEFFLCVPVLVGWAGWAFKFYISAMPWPFFFNEDWSQKMDAVASKQKSFGVPADKVTLENPRPTRESISQRVFQQTTILEKHVGNSQS